jgi:hypothetical protein
MDSTAWQLRWLQSGKAVLTRARAFVVKRGNPARPRIWRLNVACKGFFFEGLKEEISFLYFREGQFENASGNVFPELMIQTAMRSGSRRLFVEVPSTTSTKPCNKSLT